MTLRRRIVLDPQDLEALAVRAAKRVGKNRWTLEDFEITEALVEEIKRLRQLQSKAA